MQQRDVKSLPAVVDSLVALSIAIAAVVWARKQQVPEETIKDILLIRLTILNASFAIVFAVVWKMCMEALGLFHGKFVELVRPIMLNTLGCATMSALLGLFLLGRDNTGPKKEILAVFFVSAFVYEMVRITVANRPFRLSFRQPDRVIILGSGRRAGKAWRELRTQHHRTKRLLGFVDDRSSSDMSPDIAARFLGSVDLLPIYLLSNVVDELIIAAPMRSCYEAAQRAVSMAEVAGVRVVCLNDLFCLKHGQTLRDRARMFVELVPKDDGSLFAESIKRVLDVLIAAIGIVLSMPLCFVVAVAIKLTSPGPVFFVQERYGRERRKFRMWKFRSMVHNAQELMDALESSNEATGPIFKIKADPRITPFGKFLRRSSIDELPQLFNVLLGDMSLVGPRPMSVRDVSRFSEIQLLRRFSVRPGMTGRWQVGGRSSCSFEQWIAMDLSYIDDWSLSVDFEILARTIPAVFKRAGAV